MSSYNDCGDCNACCKRFKIPEIKWMGDGGKPSNTLCNKYCNGCTIYEERPKVCADYQCLWLKINSVNNSLPVSMRPDNCDVMVTAKFEDGVGQLLMDEVKEDSFDVTNMTPDQENLIKEVTALMANQTIPTALFVRSYDWKVNRINIQMEQTS